MVLPPTASESHCLHSLFRRKFNPFSDPPVCVLYFQHHEPYRWEVARGCNQYPHPAGLRVWDGWAVYQVHRGGSSWNLGYISPNEGKSPMWLQIYLIFFPHFFQQGLLPSEDSRLLPVCRFLLLLSVPERDCHCQLCSAVSSPLCPHCKWI